MHKLIGWLLGLLLFGFLIGAAPGQDGPLRNAANQLVRTDGNGYLLTVNGQYTSPDGPLQAFANTLVRTDANGYLLIAFANGLQIDDWFRLRTVNTAAPASTDCDAAAELGRLHWDSTNDAFRLCSGASGWVLGVPAGGSAPVTSGYWLDTTDSVLSAERNLGALTTGLVLNTVTAGVGVPSAYAGTSCTNQFPRSLNASGAATCASVSLTADVTGDLPFANVVQIATARVLGRNTAGTGDIEVLTTLPTAVQDTITRLGSLTVGPTNLTNGRVPYMSGGVLTDSTGLLFDGSTLTIDQTATAIQLRLTRDASSTGFDVSVAGLAGVQPGSFFTKSRGTHAAPTDVVDGDALGTFQARAYSDAVWGVASLEWVVDGSVSSGFRPPSFIRIKTNASNVAPVEALRVNRQQNVFIGNEEAYPTAGTKGLIFGDGTALSGMGTNTAGCYADDVTGTVEVFCIDEGGAATQQTPHNFTLFTPEASEEYPSSYYSRNDYLGVEVAIDTFKLARLVQTLTAQQLIYRRTLPTRRDWVNDQDSNMRRAMATYEAWEACAPLPDCGVAPSYPIVKRPPTWMEDRLRAKGWLNTVKAQALRDELRGWCTARGRGFGGGTCA